MLQSTHVVLMAFASGATALRLSRRGLTGIAAATLLGPSTAQAEMKKLRPIQFIAALGDKDASSGKGAQEWGLWRLDPGPRGVQLGAYEKLAAKGGKAPAGWQFNDKAWWLEEHGLIMEEPAPLHARRSGELAGMPAVVALETCSLGPLKETWRRPEGPRCRSPPALPVGRGRRAR